MVSVQKPLATGIRRIRVSNFKSFNSLDVTLGNFNVLIGANASGKSNFIQIFQFLRDIVSHGLDNAVSLQGGCEYLRNIGLGSTEPLLVDVAAQHQFWWPYRLRSIRISEIAYRFGLQWSTKHPAPQITEDLLTLKTEVVESKRRKGMPTTDIKVSNQAGKLKIESGLPDDAPIKIDDIFPPFFGETELPPGQLLIQLPVPFMPPLGALFKSIAIYDFDPKFSKTAVPIAGKAELEEDAANLALVLKTVIEDASKKRKFSNLLKELLPFVEDVGIERFADKSLLFKLREIYFPDEYLPSSLISDGTINVMALILALYFSEKALTIVEEPERNIHPHLISRITSMMMDASERKQIIVTTHNPEVVKHSDLGSLLLVSRGRDGFSRIERPAKKEQVRVFLKNDIGVEELFVQSLLESLKA